MTDVVRHYLALDLRDHALRKQKGLESDTGLKDRPRDLDAVGLVEHESHSI